MNILQELKELQGTLREDASNQRALGEREVTGSPEYCTYVGKSLGMLHALDYVEAIVQAAEQDVAVAAEKPPYRGTPLQRAMRLEPAPKPAPNIGITGDAASRLETGNFENAIFKAVWENVPGIDYRHAVAVTEAVLSAVEKR